MKAEQREAVSFTASPIGCLVQFTHPDGLLEETRSIDVAFGERNKSPGEVRFAAPPNGSYEPVRNVRQV